MKKKITNEEIAFIDNYLKFVGIDFLDVRIELIDHLASEYESLEEKLTLEDFMRPRKGFVKSFERKLHNKKHWSYQKRLFKRILGYFVKPKYILFSVFIISLLFGLVFILSPKEMTYLYAVTMIIPQIIHLYIYRKPKDMHRKIQSARYMLSIMSFPSLFLYFSFGPIGSIPKNLIFFMVLWFFGVISNLAGLEEVILCKKKVLKQYKQYITPA